MRCQKALIELINDYTLHDIWRIRNAEMKRYSRQRVSTGQASRIDYALLTRSLENRCENSFYFQGIETNHSAFIITMKDHIHERRVGYWKCNTTILLDEGSVNHIKKQLTEKLGNLNESSALEKWKKTK